MAAKYFGDAWQKAPRAITKREKKLRKMSKAITFGTAYGMGLSKLARDPGH